jgi:hypothetical protein
MFRKSVTHVIVCMAFGLCMLTVAGCGDKPNQVVGDSNGWTMEQYKQARDAEDQATATSAAGEVAPKAP